MQTRSTVPLLRKGVDRREFMKAAAALGLSFTMMPMTRRSARADGEATYFTWGGYDLPELQTKYKAQFGADPQFATYADTEEGLQKMLAGFVPDVMHPCTAEVPRWKNAGVLQPIDTAKLKNYANLLPELKNLPAANLDGQVWMVPWEWGFTSITYRTDPTERRAILTAFRAGRYSKLVTGRVLNEGVDVPDANVAIIASGSSATREYIQRLGRILRPKPTEAILYELITRKTSEGQSAKRRRPKSLPEPARQAA